MTVARRRRAPASTAGVLAVPAVYATWEGSRWPQAFGCVADRAEPTQRAFWPVRSRSPHYYYYCYLPPTTTRRVLRFFGWGVARFLHHETDELTRGSTNARTGVLRTRC